MNRRTSLAFLLIAVGGATVVVAQPTDSDLQRFQQQQFSSATTAPTPRVDVKKIINDSNSFLKEREPEMTTEEYAIYEKMTTLLTANPDLAIKFLEGMINEKEPPSPAFEFILGNAYYAAGQNEKAETHYRSGLKRYPTFLRAWNNLGVLYYSMERYADAIPCFTQAINLGDRDTTTLGLLAYSLEKTGNATAAEMAYIQALGGAPDNEDWKQGLLRIYVDGKQYGRAESIVRNLIREHPQDARYWLSYANVLLAERDKTKAIVVLEIAATNGTAGAEELTLLGDLYAEHQLLPEALATYQKLTTLQPAQGEQKLLQLAQVMIASGKLTEAEAVLRPLAAVKAPEHAATLRQVRADLYLAQKQWPEARRELNALLHDAPMNGRALLSLGLAYAGENDLEHATFAFESAARVPATTYRANLELANIELKNRRYQKSVEYLEKAYSIEKTEAVADLLAQVRGLAGEL